MSKNETQVAFTNWAPFTNCIAKIDGAVIDDDTDLDLLMLMYNLFQYSSNHPDTSSWWFYSKGQATNFKAQSFRTWKYEETLCSKTRQEKLLKFIKILNYIKLLCIIFCVKMSYYPQYLYYWQKELKYFGLEILAVYRILKHLELKQVFMYNFLY